MLSCALLVGSLSLMLTRKNILTPEQEAQKQRQMVDNWYANESQDSCESDLKEKLRDPKSYERDKEFSVPSDDGSKKIITWEFRAKNGFGGYAPGVGICYVGKESGGTVKTEVIN